jgi:hypothetical protein
MSKDSLTIILFLGITLLTSCVKEKQDPEINSGYLHGALITNEGAFGNNNGSVSYFNTDSSTVKNHVFESVNGRPLGDVVQSVGIAGEKAFIVVNNSQKVEVVDLISFNSIGVINGLEYPRFFLAVNDQKGYLTDGNFAGRVYVIDLATLKITDTIPCGSGPEKMILFDKTVLVANSGGWGNDSTITVIDIAKDEVTATWTVGQNPSDIVLDKDNQLWVLCKGKVVWNSDFTIAYETSSSLIAMDPGSGKLKKNVSIGSMGDYFWPQRLGINKTKDRIFYLEAGGIYSISLSATNSSKPLISKNLYGFGIDPSTDLIYTLFAPSFTTSGLLFRYQSDGVVLDSLEVGIGPSQIVFN